MSPSLGLRPSENNVKTASPGPTPTAPSSKVTCDIASTAFLFVTSLRSYLAPNFSMTRKKLAVPLFNACLRSDSLFEFFNRVNRSTSS